MALARFSIESNLPILEAVFRPGRNVNMTRHRIYNVKTGSETHEKPYLPNATKQTLKNK